MPMEVFEELGLLIENLWRERNYDEGVFPEIAARALAEADLNSRVDAWEILRWLHTTAQLPLQQDADGRFGDPPITLFNGPRFYIDIYFWLYGTTDIHQHSFAGAFQVLKGSSIHSHYRFERAHEINSHFLTGQTTLNSVRLLKEGDIQQIRAGDQYIHSLFHLDKPSATITIRTYAIPSRMPQYSYLKPHLAYDPFFKEQSIIKKAQSVSLLLNMQHPQADELISELINASDFQTTFHVLDTAFKHLCTNELENVFHLSTGRQRFDSLLDNARRKHGQLIDLLPPVFEEQLRQSNIIKRRTVIAAHEHRFFLALLLNIPDREMMLDLVRQRYPESEPVEKVLDWVDELARTKVFGSLESNILGIADFDDLHIFTLQGLLEGRSVEQVMEALADEYPSEQAANMRGRIEQVCADLINSILFKSILSDAPSLMQAATVK
jgi:hypothetical protein